MAVCRDCGKPSGDATLCDRCEAVEAALTPRGTRFVEPVESTISFPLLAPERDAPPRHRIVRWLAVGVAAVALLTAVFYAWRVGVQ